MTTDVELWLPPGYERRVQKAQPSPKAAPMPRSYLRPPFMYGLGAGMAMMYEGSPQISHFELVQLWRTLPWVRSAIRRIALTCVSEPIEIVEDRDEVEEGEDPDPEAGAYLRQFFNPDLQGPIINVRQWQLTVHKLWLTFARLKLFNLCSWEIVKNGFGDEIDFVVMPGRVVPMVDAKGYFPNPERAYIQYFEGKTQEFAVDEVLNFHVPDIEGRHAASDLEALRIAAITDLYAQAWNKNTFRNQRTPPGAWVAPEEIDDDDFDELEAKIEAWYAGVENANRAAFVTKGGLDFKSMQSGPGAGRDQEYLRGRTFNRNEMLSVLGAPAGVLGMVEDVNRSNLEGLLQILYHMEARPMQQIVETTLNLWRLWRKGIRGWRIQFRVPDFVQESDEVEIGVKAIGSGLKSRNEWRADRGLEPYDGGDTFLISAGLVPAGEATSPLYEKSAGETAKAQPADPAQPVLDELRRWKRAAIKDCERGRRRKFLSSLVPDELKGAVEKALDELDTAGEIRWYFDSVIDDLRKAGVDAATKRAASEDLQELFELAV
jgi:hypothetical protein